MPPGRMRAAAAPTTTPGGNRMDTPSRTEPVRDAAPAPGQRHIGLLLFDGVEELDAVGPWEVLAHWTREYPQDGWSVSCVSRDGRPVTCAKGLVVGAHHSFD